MRASVHSCVTCTGNRTPNCERALSGAKAWPARGEAPEGSNGDIFCALGSRFPNLSCPLPWQLSRATQESMKTKLSPTGSPAYVFLAGLTLLFLEKVLSTSWKRKNCCSCIWMRWSFRSCSCINTVSLKLTSVAVWKEDIKKEPGECLVPLAFRGPRKQYQVWVAWRNTSRLPETWQKQFKQVAAFSAYAAEPCGKRNLKGWRVWTGN